MKAAIVEGERKLVVKEVPEPVLDPDELLGADTLYSTIRADTW